MKNVAKSSKYFFGFSNTLETHSDTFITLMHQNQNVPKNLIINLRYPYDSYIGQMVKLDISASVNTSFSFTNQKQREYSPLVISYKI